MRKLIFFLAVSVSAQQIGTNARPANDPGVTFKASSQLVIETVVVKDKNGKNVEGLTAKDFAITEDNIAQPIKFFEFQKVIEEAASLPDISKVQPFARLAHTQIAPEPPGETKYRDRRLLALYFDMTAMQLPDQVRAFAAARKFVKFQMTAADLVAIMTFSGGAVRVLQDFTADRERLDATLQTLIIGEDENAPPLANDPAAADTGAAFGQDDGEFSVFTTDRQLAALQTAARMLGQLNEKKSLIYFAGGMRLNGVDNQAQLNATVNAAVRSGVSFWPVDARGLVAEAPLGDATKGSPGGIGMYTGASALSAASNFQRSQDTLYTLASDTGGKAFLNGNNLDAGIVQAQQSVTSYYILGYYTSNENLDGKFRRVKVTLTNGLTAKLDYRQGYYAGKQFNKFSVSDKERQLEDALMLGDPITELTIAMELGFFQLNRAEYFVPLIIKIPGSELALARKGGAEHTRIDFIGEVKDEFGSTIQNVRDKVDIKLSDSTAAELSKRPIQYDTGFTLLPGKYVVKFLARDAETGRIGTYINKFTIPNLNKEDKRIPISSVVLSSQRVNLKDALFNASKEKDKSENTNPLVLDGQKLIPSVTRVFSRAREMFIYLQAYQPTAAESQPLVSYVTFYSDGVKSFETQPMVVTDVLPNRLRTMPLKFSLPLSKLQPGEYVVQVTVLDPATQKAAYWQAPVMVIP